MNKKVYINGDFVSAEKAKINVGDFGLNYGWGLFETMQAYNGRVFLLSNHLKRLARGAKALDIHSPHLKKFTKEAASGATAGGATGGGPTEALLKLNGLTNCCAYVKIIVTKGVVTKSASIIIIARAMEEEKNRAHRAQGVKAIVLDEPRRYRPDIKSLNYLPNIVARKEAEKQDCYDALYRTNKDFILEGSATNVFIVRDRRIITPPSDGKILAGITREKVIKLAKEDGLNVTTAHVKTSEFTGSDEMFLTNSIIEVAPLVRVNSNAIGRGKPGEITKRIQLLYKDASSINRV